MDRDRCDVRAQIESGELWPELERVASSRMRLPRGHTEVEDIVQDSILCAMENADSIREDAVRYTTRIVIHKVCRWIDKRKKRREVTDLGELEAVAVDRKTPEPFFIAAKNELNDRLDEALRRLGESERALLHQRFFKEASLKTLGAEHGIDGGTVSRRITRLTKRLRKELGSDEID